MKKTLLSTTLLFCFSFLLLTAQDSNSRELHRLFPEGPLPSGFLRAYDYSDHAPQGPGSNNKPDLSRKNIKEFSLFTNYALNGIVRSGKLLYGDAVSNYLNTILDVILQPYPELQGKIQVFVYKSNVVNAFMMPNGMLFVNIGLIANATSESDLAYIMSHEIIHYTQQHGIDLFMDRLEASGNEESQIFDYLARHHRSRIQELEADRKGLEDFFLKTPYSPAAVSRTYDILQYGHLPFEELAFKREEVETPLYKLKDDLFIGTVNPIRSDAAYLDTLSTHPGISERRKQSSILIGNQTYDDRKEFLQDEQLFYHIRDLARYESINQDLLQENYAEAFYNIRVMTKDHPNSKELALVRVASLYGLAKSKQFGSLKNIITEKEAQGEYHGVVRFFRSINKNEALLLTLRETWKAKQVSPDDAYLNLIFDDLTGIIFGRIKLELADFSDFGMYDTSYLEIKTSHESVTSKYNLAKTQTLVFPQKDWDVYRYMMADFKSDPAFTDQFNRAILRYKEGQLKELTRRTPDKATLRKASLEMYIMEPVLYLDTDDDDHVKLKPKRDRRQIGSLRRSLLKLPRSLNIATTPLWAFPQTNAPTYGAYAASLELGKEVLGNAIINQVFWSSTALKQLNLYEKDQYLVFYNQKIRKASSLDFEFFFFDLLSFIQYPLAPVGLYHLFVPRYDVTMSFAVIDTKTAKVVFSNNQRLTQKLRQDYIRDFMYRSFASAKKSILTDK